MSGYRRLYEELNKRGKRNRGREGKGRNTQRERNRKRQTGGQERNHMQWRKEIKPKEGQRKMEGKIIILASEMAIAVFPSRVKNSLVSTSSRTVLGPIQHPIQWVLGALSPGVKRPGRDVGHRLQPMPRSRRRDAVHPLPHTPS
jgi:hypothetical protein